MAFAAHQPPMHPPDYASQASPAAPQRAITRVPGPIVYMDALSRSAGPSSIPSWNVDALSRSTGPSSEYITRQELLQRSHGNLGGGPALSPRLIATHATSPIPVRTGSPALLRTSSPAPLRTSSPTLIATQPLPSWKYQPSPGKLVEPTTSVASRSPSKQSLPGSYVPQGPSPNGTARDKLDSEADETCNIFASGLTEHSSWSRKTHQETMASFQTIRESITSHKTEVSEAKQQNDQVYQQMQAQLSDLREKINHAFNEIRSLVQSKTQSDKAMSEDVFYLQQILQKKAEDLETLKLKYSEAQQTLQTSIAQVQNYIQLTKNAVQEVGANNSRLKEESISRAEKIDREYNIISDGLKKNDAEYREQIRSLQTEMGRCRKAIASAKFDFVKHQRNSTNAYLHMQTSLTNLQTQREAVKRARSSSPVRQVLPSSTSMLPIAQPGSISMVPVAPVVMQGSLGARPASTVLSPRQAALSGLSGVSMSSPRSSRSGSFTIQPQVMASPRSGSFSQPLASPRSGSFSQPMQVTPRGSRSGSFALPMQVTPRGSQVVLPTAGSITLTGSASFGSLVSKPGSAH